MKTKLLVVMAFVGGIVIGAGSLQAIRAQADGYATTEILQTDLNNLPGQEVRLFTSTWQPGSRLPWHVHAEGHEFTFVIEGEQTFEMEGAGTKVVKAGEVFYTPPNTPHYGRNATDKVSKTLVIRIKAKDKPVMTVLKK